MLIIRPSREKNIFGEDITRFFSPVTGHCAVLTVVNDHFVVEHDVEGWPSMTFDVEDAGTAIRIIEFLLELDLNC